MNAPDFKELHRWAEAETGMDLSGDRAVRFRDALERVLGRPKWGGEESRPALAVTTAEGSLDRLSGDLGSRTLLLERLTAELTVGETFFFRNADHFQALREHVLPAILADNAAKREVHFWSAGCATGEEPYSLAILLDQVLAGQPWQVRILATDINPAFLARARDAVYRLWSFRFTTLHQDGRYFAPEGDTFRLVPSIRQQVRFAYLNLVKDVYPSPLTGTLGLDLILFRNVAIYLKPEVTRAIITHLRHALRPGGWLLVSEVELNLVPTDGFEVLRLDRATFFRKRPDLSAAEMPLLLPAPVLAPIATSLSPPVPTWLPLSAPPPAAPPAPPWERIQVHLDRKEWAAAEAVLARLADGKERAALRLRYAQSLLARAEQGRARQALATCLHEDPLLLEARLLQGSFDEEMGDLAAAEQAYRHALYIDRTCAMGHFHLALVQQQRGDRAGAARSLKTAWKLIEGRDLHSPVEYGEGICYGRLREMVAVLIGD